MKIVILGARTHGSFLAKTLAHELHDVIVIDWSYLLPPFGGDNDTFELWETLALAMETFCTQL